MHMERDLQCWVMVPDIANVKKLIGRRALGLCEINTKRIQSREWRPIHCYRLRMLSDFKRMNSDIRFREDLNC